VKIRPHTFIYFSYNEIIRIGSLSRIHQQLEGDMFIHLFDQNFYWTYSRCNDKTETATPPFEHSSNTQI